MKKTDDIKYLTPQKSKDHQLSLSMLYLDSAFDKVRLSNRSSAGKIYTVLSLVISTHDRKLS